jgi:Abnormal spindle-like microcephaly-assoc'd, ASPM-SPD-2-Hydin
VRRISAISKYFALSLIIVFTCLGAVGCGGGGMSASAPPPSGPTPTPTPVSGSPSLTATPNNLGFGTQALNTSVTLNVKITNVGTAAANITQDSISGAGFSAGITTPITLNPQQSVSIPVVFTPGSAGTVSGSLTFSANGTTMLSVPLSGTGLAPLAHSVDVTWNASTSASLQGYNVYRSGLSGGPYTKISPTLSPTTLLFTDTTPLSGQKYFYVVTAVDTSGAESAASSEVAVAIPTP